MKEIYAIILAGGSGLRMKSSLPKQFIEIKGQAILQRTIIKFVNARPNIKIIVVLGKEFIDWWKEYCEKTHFHVPHKVVAGGLSRFHSVQNALKTVPDGVLVAIHDGVRPLISSELINNLLDKVEKEGKAVIPIVPSVDTLRLFEKNKEGKLQEVKDLDRSQIYGIQTPQCFLSEKIKQAYNQAFDIKFTDDSTVAKAYGLDLAYFIGERWNIKITTPEDLKFAELFL